MKPFLIFQTFSKTWFIIFSKFHLGIIYLFLSPALVFSQAQEFRGNQKDTIYVSPPTGEPETDRINIQEAFDAVEPHGTILFSPGTYFLGAGATLTVPDVTILGHPEGTILRGCDPEAFAVEESEVISIVFGCTGLYVQAERQTIRNITFEYMWHAIVVGPFPTSAEEAQTLGERGESPPDIPVGGQIIENNTFRSNANGLRMLGIGEELSLVRNNDFIDVFHAIVINGAPLHFRDNRITVENPESVPFSNHPGSAVIISPGATNCEGYIVERNLIKGYPDPIYVMVRPGEICRDVIIQDNTIQASRVKVPRPWATYIPTAEDSTMVGAPITLMNMIDPKAENTGVLTDILIRGNKIIGADGVGIIVQNSSRNRIEGNTFSNIKIRKPFPGITWDGEEQNWKDANGSGIWISPGSNKNEITGNNFEEIASYPVFLEGDSTRVELLKSNDSVKDIGKGNTIFDKN